MSGLGASKLISFSRFLSPGDEKPPPPSKELLSISTSLDDSLLHFRDLKKSASARTSTSCISLAWLSSAVKLLASAHSEAYSLLSSLDLVEDDSSVNDWYLDGSLKVLDICNCLAYEIDRLCHRRLLLRSAVHILRSNPDPSPERLLRARDLLSDSESKIISNGFVNPGLDVKKLIGDLVATAGTTHRASDSPIVRRAVQAVSLVTAFVAGAVASALSSSPAIVRVRFPAEFPWAGLLNDLESAISAELEKRRLITELDEAEACARRLRDIIDEVEASDWTIDTRKGTVRMKLDAAINELEEASETSLEGLERLREAINGAFGTVMRIRTEMVDNLRESAKAGPLSMLFASPFKNVMPAV